MKLLATATLFLCSLGTLAQSPLTSGYFNYHLIDRQEIRGDQLLPGIFTSLKPYRRDVILTSIDTTLQRSLQDRFNDDYLHADQPEYSTLITAKRGLWGTFYRHSNALYAVNHVGEDGALNFTVNPVLHFQGQNDDRYGNGYINSRGFVIRGVIGNKVGFFTKATENQAILPNYLGQRAFETGVLPGAGFHKALSQQNGFDYFLATGYVSFSPIKEIMMQFGHDRNFLGNGYRSMILSDNATAYPFMKINSKIWKLNYTNLFTELSHYDVRQRTPSKKFTAFHQLSVNIGKHLNIGLFENIVFDRQDSNESNGYELQYLNPIIFYRAVEHGLNSTDNAMLGMDFKWNFLNRFSLYGQWLFDEFKKKEFFGGTDHWANKWAYQLGLKYINVAGINNLDLQLELNQARPFVYSHRQSTQNYSHFGAAMAHPLGANFREFLAIVRAQPLDRLNLFLLVSSAKQGRDTSWNSNSFGASVLRDNDDVADTENSPMFQGSMEQTLNIRFNASYMLYHNLFIDLGANVHQSTFQSVAQEQLWFHMGLRLNASRPKIY